MQNRLIETVMGSDWPLVKNSLFVGLVAFVMSASALELPEFISTNNVTELRYREWGAVSGPVQTVKIEFAIRRVEFFWYNSGCLEKDGIPAVHGERRFDVQRTLYCQDGKVNERISENKAWLEILSDLSAADIGAWQEWYDNPGVCDGALWRLELWSGTNLVKRCGGSNAVPVQYRKLLSALNRIGGSFGAEKFGVQRTIYDAMREKAEEEPDSEKRKKLLELLEEIEKDTKERKAASDAERAKHG